MAEAELLKVQPCDKSIDYANRILPSHIIFDSRWEQAYLIPAYPGLERATHHTESYTPPRKPLEFLPSLFAPPILRTGCKIRKTAADFGYAGP